MFRSFIACLMVFFCLMAAELALRIFAGLIVLRTAGEAQPVSFCPQARCQRVSKVLATGTSLSEGRRMPRALSLRRPPH